MPSLNPSFTPSLNNVVISNTASQSCNYFPDGRGVATKAVDGNTNGNYFAEGSVTHTCVQLTNWWRADLEAGYIVDHVLVYNRNDCCRNRIVGTSVQFLDANDTVLCSQSITAVNNVYNLDFSGSDYIMCASQARRIRLLKENEVAVNDNAVLSLAEVEVMGRVKPLPRSMPSPLDSYPVIPSATPSSVLSSEPSSAPSGIPIRVPSSEPSSMPSAEPNSLSSDTYILHIDKECDSCYIALREVTFYSDIEGTKPLVSATPGVESLTATESSELSYQNFDFSANVCIDGSVGDRCAGDGHICHSGWQPNPSFTFTLVSDVPPASFRIDYRRCSSNNFPPTRANLIGWNLDFSQVLSNSVDSALYPIPSSSPTPSTIPPIAICTSDLKTCPGGRLVGRDPSNGCAWLPCPLIRPRPCDRGDRRCFCIRNPDRPICHFFL